MMSPFRRGVAMSARVTDSRNRAMGGLNGNSVPMAPSAATGYSSSRGTRFALAKFRPPALPPTLITRSVLHDQLTTGADQRLTVVVGSAGAGKSVLLSDWAATR